MDMDDVDELVASDVDELEVVVDVDDVVVVTEVV